MKYFLSLQKTLLIFLAVISTEIFSVVATRAQLSTPDSLVWYWHRAYFPEIGGDPKASIESYKKVSEFCETLPLDVREWYKGVSFFGIARAEAALADREATRKAFSQALARHFWNFPVIRTMKIFDTVCGKEWIDSTCAYWSAVRDKEIEYWHPQSTLLLKPKYLQPGAKYPVLIVLQGGNDCYERLIVRLKDLPDSLGIILVFPAAVHRISEVSNSWDDDTTAAEAKITTLIQELSSDLTVDKTNISLFGYSQGSQIAYSFGLSHPDQIRNIIAFSGFVPGVIQEAKLRNAAAHQMKIIAVSGSSDSPEFLRTSQQLHEEAEQQGLSFDLKIESDLPHGLPMEITTYIMNLWKQLSRGSNYKEGNIPPGH
jgi:phospholipase/carboxylesterase